MLVVLKQETYRVKNGFAARSPELKLAAHGISPEIARRNLEDTVLSMLKPLERQGNLPDMIRSMGLTVKSEEGELAVVFAALPE